MRGSYSECPKCGNKNLNIKYNLSSFFKIAYSSSHVDGFIDCEKCGKIVEERVAELSTLYGESYVDEDLYVVADDLNSFSENITKVCTTFCNHYLHEKRVKMIHLIQTNLLLYTQR